MSELELSEDYRWTTTKDDKSIIFMKGKGRVVLPLRDIYRLEYDLWSWLDSRKVFPRRRSGNRDTEREGEPVQTRADVMQRGFVAYSPCWLGCSEAGGMSPHNHPPALRATSRQREGVWSDPAVQLRSDHILAFCLEQ